MSHKIPRLAATFVAFSGLLPASGAVQSGPDVIALYHTYGGSFTDFSGLSGGFSQVPGLLGATFQTTRDRSFFNDNEILMPLFATEIDGNTAFLGTRADGMPTPQSLYQIVFDDPQLFAGLDRRFNTQSLTHFYNGDTLLYTYQNATNTDFAGWVGDEEDSSTWVTRVVLDGLQDTPAGGNPRGLYQTGYSDNLYFGVPEPSSLTYSLFALTLFARRRRG
ncbi:hypothetical protein [Haloferula sp.]|uniref:hypothetical protein n=1 Tax=Haloferula sp. TaxID=2497595 RepID=UPI00329F2511